MKKTQKIMSILLSLAMVFGLLVPSTFATERRYNDTENHWAENAIGRWSDYGIIEGNGDSFDPDNSITRAQMATILSKALGLTETAENPFSDVSKDSWYEPYILRCFAAGIMLGDNGKANPDKEITRQEAITMFCRAFGIEGEEIKELSAFKDKDAVSDWALPSVSALINRGIVSGVTSNMISPATDMSRASLVTILDRAIVQYINNGGEYELTSKDGIILVSAGDVTLKGETKADILITSAAKGKKVTFNDATVTGNILVKADSIEIEKNNSTLPEIKGEGVKVTDTTKAEITKPAENTGSGGGGGGGGGGTKPSTTDLTIRGNKAINGGTYDNVTIAKSVGDGEVTLRNVTIKGNLTIKGGGSSSINLENCHVKGKVILAKESGEAPRLELTDTPVATVEVQKPAIIEAVDNASAVTKIEATANVEIKGEKTKIDTLAIPETAESAVTVTVTAGSIETVEAKAETTVTGASNSVDTIIATAAVTADSEAVQKVEIPETATDSVSVTVTGDAAVDVEINSTSGVAVTGANVTVSTTLESAPDNITIGGEAVTHIHKWGEPVTTPATCEQDGEVVYTCVADGCGDTAKIKTEVITKLGHTYGDWVKSDDYLHVRECANDKEHYEKEEHTWDEGKVTTEPTCEQEGIKTFTCSVCKGKKTEAIPENGHAWGEWVKADATSHKRVCKTNASHTEIADHTPIIDSAEDATCTETGKTEGSHCDVCNSVIFEQTTIPALNHNFTGEYEKDADGHWHICIRDNCEETDTKADHTYNTTNCAEVATCTACGYEKPAGEHSWGDWEKVDEENHKRTCSCTATETEEHKWDDVEITTAATCEEDGVKTYTCSVCKGTKTEPVSKTGHSWGDWEKSDDELHVRFCKNDSEHYEKADHSWNDGEITTAATCEEDGVKTYTCSVCKGTKTEPVSKTGHSWGDWEKLDNELHVRHCKNDEEHYEKAEHDWDEGKVTVEANCGETGILTYTCKACNGTKAEVIEKTLHDWGEWKKADDKTHKRLCSYDTGHYEIEDHIWEEKINISLIEKISGYKKIFCDICEAEKTYQLFTVELGLFYGMDYGDYFTVAYKEGDSIKSLKVDRGVAFFVNGIEDKTENAFAYAIEEGGDFYEGPDGSITFLDEDGDGIYDQAFLETLSLEIVVDEINSEIYKLYGKYGSSLKLDPEEYIIYYYKDGEEATFDDIEIGDVVSVAEGEEGSFMNVYISSRKVTGYVSDCTSNGYKISGNLYKASYFLGCDINRRDAGTFFINYSGKIAHFERVDETVGTDYGFLLAVNTDVSFATGVTYTLRFMNTNGEWVDANLADSIKCITWNEENLEMTTIKITDIEDIADIDAYTNGWLTTTTDEDGVEALVMDAALTNRVFKYALNEDGEVIKIVIAKEELSEDDFSYEVLEDEYDAVGNRFGAQTFKGGVNEDTAVFIVDLEEGSEYEDPQTIDSVFKKKQVALADHTIFENEAYYEGFLYDYADGVYKCVVLANVDLPEEEGGDDSTEGDEIEANNYGFLLAVNTDVSFATGVTYTLRFMTTEGEWVDANFAESITYTAWNGEKMESHKITDIEDITDIDAYTNGWLTTTTNEDGVEALVMDAALTNRVFKYALNENGEVIKIVIAKEELSEDDFSYEVLEDEYDAVGNRFGAQTFKGGVNEDTVVFIVDLEEGSEYEEPQTITSALTKKQIALADYTVFEDGACYEGFIYDYADGVYKCVVLVNIDLPEEEVGDDDTEDEETEATDYGFLLAVNTEASFAEGITYTLRFMTTNGEWIDANLADSVKCIAWNGEEMESNKIVGLEDIADIEAYTNGWLTTETNNDGVEALLMCNALENRVFKYALNEDGEVIKIVVANGELSEDNFSYEVLEDEYDAVANRFDNQTFRGGVNEDTVVFIVDLEEGSEYEEPQTITSALTKKQVTFAEYTVFEDEAYYEGFIYDYDYVDCEYKCVVLTNIKTTIKKDANFLIVNYTEILEDLDEEGYSLGEKYILVNGYLNGEEITLKTKADDNLKEAVEITVLGEPMDDYADIENYCNGAIFEVKLTTNGVALITKINIVFEGAEAFWDGIPEGRELTSNEDDALPYYYFGAIATEKIKSSSSAKFIELIDLADGSEVIEVATAGSFMKGNIYNVDLTGRKAKYYVADSIADYVGSVIYDNNGNIDFADMDGEDVNFALVKVFEDEVIDIVVYTVEYVCE